MKTSSPEREKLAHAIAATRAAEQSLDEARRALAHAEAKWSASAERAGSISRQIEEIEEVGAETSSGSLISSLARGDDLDVLDKSKNDLAQLRARLAEAEEESARWRQVMKVAEATIADRKQALDLAAHYVDGDARKVIAAEVDISDLMRDAESARAAVLDAQARLAALAASMDHSNEKRRQIDNFVNDIGWLRDSPWRDRPAATQIKTMFDALKRDASAPLEI
jgi:chromosome segregation ATPase